GEATTDPSCRRPRVLIGRDTRRSGKMLEGALAAGITSAGADAVLAGVVPTPAISLLLAGQCFDAGVVISASHNPPEYNGMKVFWGTGKKLDDAQQEQIEALLQSDEVLLPGARTDRPTGTQLGRVETFPGAAAEYVAKLTAIFPYHGLQGLRVAIDCGHGAACKTTPAAFEALGATISVINDDYSGDDINVACGSTNLKVVAEAVQSGDFDLGIAHDGDADRMLAVDQNGAVIDGDQLMAICAQYLKDKGEMDGLPVVSTVMANLGFARALQDRDIAVEITDVGDRHVLQRMYETGAILGGEQSGHLIFLQHNSSGDGLLSALMLAHILVQSGKSLSDLAGVMKHYPQVLHNVPVASKDIASSQALQAAISDACTQLGDSGRVLIRPSGTEKLVRVMVEAADEDQAEAVATSLAAVVAQELA
ncbi:MAG: phosphoglucosamine mutase, partial [Coriobacteriia bacterium]|nr:phosphoglucosamine mutase [Coriobacteriia bacterium]